MESVISCTKVGKILLELQNKCEKDYQTLLFSGDLLEFERLLKADLLSVYDTISEIMLQLMALKLSESMREKAENLGMSKLEERPVSFQIATGYEVTVNSYYGCKVGEDFEGSRYALLRHWGIIEKCSPSYYDKVGMCAIISPSYALSNQLLTKLNVKNTISHNRKVMNSLGTFCSDKEEELVLKSGENVRDKRIVISIDGGRTRTRVYNGNLNEAGNECYASPWCEPKLFVIDVLNEFGKVDPKESPIYGSRFAEQDVLDLLKRYLVLLDIKTAKSVQIIADGAPWIWLNIKKILLELGLESTKIVETLDYCHAMSYINILIKAMPKNKKGKILTTSWDEKTCLKQAKEWAWNGKIAEFVSLSKLLFPNPNQDINQAINYLDKHQNRMQYADYQKDKLLCGSGIIESAIRRIINLRFKNASTFWDKQTVEKLFLFRAVLVSNRWDIFIKNLAKKQA